MKLSIIIPVYNNWNFTKSVLKDLSKLPDDHEIIVIDNGSKDETVNLNKLKEVPKNLKVIINKDNRGFGEASNQGYLQASGEHILFLNNDIRVSKDHSTWTQSLLNESLDGSIVGPNGGLLDNNFNFIRETTTIEPGNFYMSGWCLCAKKEVFDKLVPINNKIKGPFSEEFFCYFEDTDLGFRARKQNIPMKIITVPVIHFGKITSSKVGISNLYLKSKTTFITKWTKINA